jgi:hypothetical protein
MSARGKKLDIINIKKKFNNNYFLKYILLVKISKIIFNIIILK